MNDNITDSENEQELRTILQRELPRLKNVELRRDLWPQMSRRLEARPVRIPWFDWALAAGVVAALLLFPGAIPALLYHL